MSRPNLIDDVFALVLEGKSNVEIAKLLNRSISSINRYMGLILKRYDVKTRNELYVKLANEDKETMLQDWSYEEEESGRSETLIKAIEKIERLEKQLDIAMSALKELTNSDNWSVEQIEGEHVFCFNMKYPWRFTGEALRKIKELNDVEPKDKSL